MITTHPFDDKLHEECGVFGIYGHRDAAAHTALGLHALQHRGQEAAGMVVFDGKQFNAHREMGLVGELLPREDHPEWITEAKVRPLVARGAVLLVSILPERLRREIGEQSGTAKSGIEELQRLQDYQNLLNPPAKGDAPAGEPGYNLRERDEMRRAVEGIGGSGEESQ